MGKPGRKKGFTRRDTNSPEPGDPTPAEIAELAATIRAGWQGNAKAASDTTKAASTTSGKKTRRRSVAHPYEPTPPEIEKACEEIQAAWTPTERKNRAGRSGIDPLAAPLIGWIGAERGAGG
ncbi:MAG: hypothetical protein AB7O62_11440 [Pirellulales bacterium]